MIDHYSISDWFAAVMVILNIIYVMYLYFRYLVLPAYYNLLLAEQEYDKENPQARITWFPREPK